MPSHFSTIGMSVNSEEDMLAIAEKASDDSVEIVCKSGHYLKWSSEEGAELWLQIDKKNDLVGLTPSFSGKSQMLVGITNAIERPDDTAFEGMIHGWANPQKDEPKNGDYPFVFDLVNKATYEDFDFPFISEVKLSAFAHEMTVYSSLEDYDSEQTEEPKFASESFIPSGLFKPDDTEDSHPEPYAIFTGRVLKCRKLKNSLTNGEYHWALVKTLGGTIDVLSDPTLSNKEIAVDGIISGSFWLNGKIINPKIKAKKGIIHKLFSKKA